MSEGSEVLDLAKTSFRAEHLATRPLVAVDPLTLARLAHDVLAELSFDIAPVDDGGSHYRYVEREWLASEGRVADLAQPIEALHMIPSSAPVAECLKRLTSQAWFFVLDGEEVTGIITLADLQRPALALFAFANILAIEAHLKSAIANVENWPTHLTPDRLRKLQEIHEVRRRYNVETGIVDVLTIEDKMRLATKLKLYAAIGFKSGNDFDGWAEETKRLRDVLAHGGGVLDQQPDPAMALAQVLRLYGLADAVFRGPA